MNTDPTVLVVDDDSDIREAVAFVLESSGYNVAMAADGAEALQQLADARPLPVAILLDLRMPGMDGEQFRVAQLREPAFASVPVVVLSGDRNVAARARALGIERYVQKPVSLDVLLDEIERCRGLTQAC